MRICVIISIVCVGAAVTSAADEMVMPLLALNGIEWTAEEIRYLHDLHQKGRISIATKISSAVYLPQEDGTIKGFHYNVLNAFAVLADLAIDIRLVAWDDYFYKSGEDLEQVKLDPKYTYTPTLIEEVDLYMDGITALPWREKMFDILKFVPSRQLVVTRKNEVPHVFTDLDKKTCAMVKDTSMEFNLEHFKREHKIHFTYLYTDNFDAMERMVAEGQADFTVYDSDRAFEACYHYPNLTIAMPVSDVEIMGWAIHKDKSVLKGVLEKYLDYAQEHGILDTCWKEEYGVSFLDYFHILELR